MIPLAAAAAVALCTLLLSRSVFPLGALFALLATFAALQHRAAVAGFAALPILLVAAVPPPRPAPAPPIGPVQLCGVVVKTAFDPVARRSEVVLATAAGRLRLAIAGSSAALPGDRLVAVARCSPAAVPDGAPRLQADPRAVTLEAGPWSLPRACAQLRRELERQLLAMVPGERGALVCSLVLGAATRLPGEISAAHRATGLSHLLAVSGAHAAMLAWLLGLQRFGGRQRPIGRGHLLLGFAILVSYGLVTGMEPPVFRALCSYGLAALAIRSGRRMGVVQALAWPALLSCIVDPEGSLGASFCLSYAAVAGLALAGGPRRPGRLEAWLLLPVRSSFWATTTTAPWTLAWFGQLAPWTVLWTPVLAPLVAALLFLGLGAGIAATVHPEFAAGCCAPLLRALAGCYSSLVLLADTLPGTPFLAAVRPQPLWLAAGVVAAASVLVLLPTRRGALLCCVLCCLPHFVAPCPPQLAGLHLFAVGHGQACLLRLADGTQVVVDCGSMQHSVLPARKIAAELHRRRIDRLILTHADHDHLSAVPALLGLVAIDHAVLPEAVQGHRVAAALEAAGCRIDWLAPGARLELPGLTVAAPDPGPGTGENDHSLWVRADLAGTVVLLPGDAESAGIKAALAAGIASPCDVLLLPHHGRPGSAVETLLRTTTPRLCLVSNRGSDGASALAGAALGIGVPTFSTGLAGDLAVLVDGTATLLARHGLRLPLAPP